MGLIAAIVIPIVVIGYLGVCIPPEFRWRIAYQDAKTLHFKVLQYGMMYVSIAFVMLTASYYAFSFPLAIELQEFIPHYLPNSSTRAGIAWLILLFVLSLAVVIVHFCIYRIYRAIRLGVPFKKGEFNWQLTLKTWQDFCKDKPLDNLLFSSLQDYLEFDRAVKTKRQQKDTSEECNCALALQAMWDKCARVLLTMEDRKVYMGIITELTPHQQFKILPLLSGYRDEKNHMVIFTTDYAKVEAQHIILKTENIMSATQFDKKIYATFKEQRGNKASLSQTFFDELMEKFKKSPD